LPVVDGEAGTPVGWLTHLGVLRAYNARLQQGIDDARRSAPVPGASPRRPSGALARLRGYRIVDLDLATAGPPVGRRIADVPWPRRSTVLAVRRGDDAFEPAGTEQLERGDRLTVLVPARAADDLVDTITGDCGGAP
jgi:hypothetical protein